MVYFFSSKSLVVGHGHYARSIELKKFLTKNKIKTNFFIFTTLKKLEIILNKINFNINDIIFYDSYLINNLIIEKFKNKVHKVIINNDFQFKIPKVFYNLNYFRYCSEIKNINKNSNTYFGINYLPYKNKELIKFKTKKYKRTAVIFSSQKKNLFLKETMKLLTGYKKKIYFFNSNFKKTYYNKHNQKLIFNTLIEYKKLIKFCMNSEYVICSGGNTMMSLIINNIKPNVISKEENQKLFSDILYKKKKIYLVSKNVVKLGKNKKTNYFINNKNKILEMLK